MKRTATDTVEKIRLTPTTLKGSYIMTVTERSHLESLVKDYQASGWLFFSKGERVVEMIKANEFITIKLVA